MALPGDVIDGDPFHRELWLAGVETMIGGPELSRGPLAVVVRVQMIAKLLGVDDQ